MLSIHLFRCFAVGLVITCLADPCQSQSIFGPDDPIVSVNGEPVFVGELNLALIDRLRIRDLDKAPIKVQQATSVLLIRQHLAMLSLRKLGGESLAGMIDREIATFAVETKRRGSSLEAHAQQRKASVKSLKKSLAFQIAWRQYLKSQLTEANLKRYFQSHQEKYAGGRWDVSQVFMGVDAGDDTALEIATQRMAKLIEEINQSPSKEAQFGLAAREQSESPSGKDGGKIGWVEKDGDLPSSVMKAVRTTKPGALSGAVRSPLGLHCVFVHAYEAKDVQFSDLTDVAQLRRDATDTLFHRLVRQQKDAKINWFISGLKPPANISLIPPE